MVFYFGKKEVRQKKQVQSHSKTWSFLFELVPAKIQRDYVKKMSKSLDVQPVGKLKVYRPVTWHKIIYKIIVIVDNEQIR